MCNPDLDLDGLNFGILSPTMEGRYQKCQIYTLEERHEQPRLFHMGFLPGQRQAHLGPSGNVWVLL